MPCVSSMWLLVAALTAIAHASPQTASTTTTTTSSAPACTATSSTGSGAYFDLRPDTAVLAPDKGSKSGSVAKDYHARGWDYGKNFTLNICGAVVDPITDVVGLKKSQWGNVSAYYVVDDDVYSIGSVSLNLHSRGRKLVLQYSNGSPCGEGKRRKSTTISFLCDKDPGSSTAVSFVGTDPDECAYFFEARSLHACGHAEPHKPGSVGPGSVFGLILAIAVLVYLLGGVFYNRTVAHARGWRQLPNYSLWAGIWSFFSDLFIIVLSSCRQWLPERDRGYSHIASSHPGRDRSDAENRLIDQLDEEWDE